MHTRQQRLAFLEADSSTTSAQLKKIKQVIVTPVPSSGMCTAHSKRVYTKWSIFIHCLDQIK